MDEFLEGCSSRERELSLRMTELLRGKVVRVARISSSERELFIEFEDGRRLYANVRRDKLDLSIT